MKQVGFLSVLSAALVGCEKPNTFVPPAPPTVSVAEPIVQEVTEYVEFTGRTAATETVQLRARVKGFLESVEFEPGELVESGELLFTIEREPFEAALEAAKAEVARNQAAVDLAATTSERYRKANSQGAATELEVAEAEAKEKQARANLQAAEASVQDAEINLSYCEIHTPISGRVSRELVDAGNLVGAGDSTLLTTVVQDNPLFVYFTVNERELLKYLEHRPDPDESNRENIAVQLRLADGRLYDKPGRIDFADNRIDPLTGTLEARAVFPNPDGILYPGLFARIRAPIETAEAMLVPDVAMQRDVQGYFVYVVDAENVVHRRQVERGNRHGQLRVVTGGLEPGEMVIVNGIQRARDGLTVEPQTIDVEPDFGEQELESAIEQAEETPPADDSTEPEPSDGGGD